MRRFLPLLAVVIVLLLMFGTIYSAVQQSQRSGANDPQIQLAEDTAAKINANPDDRPRVYGIFDDVNMAKSLAPFTIIYDKSGKAVVGNGYLDGKTPKLDKSMLEASKDQDYHAVTWEPKDDVRIAAVIVKADDYYVLSGRNLKEVEKNENKTFVITASGFVISLLFLGISGLVAGRSDMVE